ncbi:MAG: Inosine-uridine preferring nucleoside hydrolase [uncultured Thermomicrobiales bacterium]|uniref:Inosine-uridine preferring nucleoside hydrolase n=1 Tax=uncultured Thermomicrobiales bacterium TaxID=1645740 RepID=A0A6J4VIQ5_9BACT|nr:MAG: Inosine-uridine preferring nucleoside hydrolase [uncultured Thermomicrobiales bacterium]
MAEAVPVILDVDTGVDDALAIALAVSSPRVDLVAVTTLAGNVDVDRTTANTLAVLDWLGADSVPVHRGASRPLARPHVDAAFVHGTDGLGNAGLPPSPRGVGADRGPAAIIRLASARPGQLTLVCVGPLTNLAIALNVEPTLPSLLAGVVVMGGAYRVPGNVTPRAEFNIYCDPEAAAQVLATPFPRLTLIGLDVTEQVVLSRAAWTAAADGNGPVAGLVDRIGRRAFVERGLAGTALHDPLALAAAVEPSLVAGESAGVTVGTEGEARGETRLDGAGSAVVASTVDPGAALRFLSRELGLPSLI